MSNATLNRFYSFHYLFPFLLIILAVVHLIALHQKGSNDPLGLKSDFDKAPFHPYYVFKDVYGIVILIGLLCLIVFFFPYILGDVENFKEADPLVTPVHIKPE